MTEAEVREVIRDLDLSSVRERVHVQHPEVSLSKLDALEEEYRGFLFINWKYSEEKHIPSMGIDEFWHAHILHTRDYMRDCQEIFGYYFHHDIFRHDQSQ